MPYDSLTSRADSAALVPEDVSRDMLGRVRDNQSAVMQLFRNVPVIGSQTRFPILSALPIAYWVTGDTGLKQTSEAAWTNKYLNIEEVAVIVPIPENVVDDLDAGGVDVWEEIRPDVEEAIGVALDTAVFFGTNAPASFPDDIVTAATAAGNTAVIGTSTTAEGGILGDLDAVFAEVEDDGYDVTGIVATRALRGLLRRARNTTGERLGGVGEGLADYDGVPIVYSMRGLWPTAVSTARAFAGDFSEFVVGVRKDITVDIFREGVIQDGSNAIVYNLMQQDMVAARFTFRAGWQVSNRINREAPVEANRYPVGVLLAAAS